MYSTTVEWTRREGLCQWEENGCALTDVHKWGLSRDPSDRAGYSLRVPVSVSLTHAFVMNMFLDYSLPIPLVCLFFVLDPLTCEGKGRRQVARIRLSGRHEALGRHPRKNVIQPVPSMPRSTRPCPEVHGPQIVWSTAHRRIWLICCRERSTQPRRGAQALC